MRVCAVVSGGKDSWYAVYIAMLYGFEINPIVTFIPKKEDSYMLHNVNVAWVALQARVAGFKHYTFEVSGEREKEVEEMKKYLTEIVRKNSVEAVVCGAVKSEYQKYRIDMMCEELGVKSYAPLWHKNEAMLLHEIVNSGFEFIITKIAAEGIEKWVGKKINEGNVDEFIFDLKRLRVNLIGEGGEYETFLLDAPFFKRKIEVISSKIVKNDATLDFVFSSLKEIPK